MTILFAVGYEDADALIEELIRAEPNPRRLVVVSSDRRIQRAARRRKASAADSEAWYGDLSRRRRRRQAAAQDNQALPAKPSVPLLEEEVAYWLSQFGGESIESEAAEIADPFPPGYAEDLPEEDSGGSEG